MTWARDPAAYNLRQLGLALGAIDEYAAGTQALADLGRLVSTLEALSAALEAPDEQWAESFDDEIFGLETVYAVRLDRGGELTDHDTHIIDETIEKLRGLVRLGIEANQALESEAPS
jgi:hypothetical protein